MDTTLSDPLVDRLLEGRYSIHHRIARGGMASVYLATDTRLDRAVAVKIMHPHYAEDPAFLRRFDQEARAIAGLNHTNVVSVYDQGTEDGHPFLVMEFVPGQTLRTVLTQRGRLSPGEAVAVMDHVLAALGAAHAAGLVHRDVKPENVLVTPDGRVKVADFGLARAGADSTVTATTGSIMGTVAYLAPEQVRDGRSDARSDVYAAGVMFFELLTGAPPFSGDTPIAVASMHVNDDVPAPSSRVAGIPDELDAVVLAATARDPDERPADARALHASLLAVRDRLGLHADVPTAQPARSNPTDTLVVERPAVAAPPPDEPPARTRRRRRRWPYAVALLVVAALAAAYGGWYLAVGRYTATPNVVGLPKAAAIAKLKAAGLHARWQPSVYNDSIAANLVATESPTGGHDLRKGGTVTLALSLGHDHVPDVRGKTVVAATALLQRAQLVVGGQDEVYSDTVAKGRVIRTDPSPGQQVSPKTAVTLVVSKGPAPITVPDVSNKPLDQATSILQALGLSVTTTKDFSDTVKQGYVIRTTPPSGATAHKGDAISVVVSQGPHLYPVPDVRGHNINDAIRIIEQAGFVATPKQIFPGGPGNVFRQSPTGMQRKGTKVELDYF